MRTILLTVMAACAAAPAFASSIERIEGTRLGNGGMVNITCTDCPPPQPPERKSTYKVPELGPEVQKEELRVVNGERMLMRTERWTGGSPTVYYQKITPEIEAAFNLKENGSDDAIVTVPDGVDPTAKTAAVGVEPPQATTLFSDMELRLK